MERSTLKATTPMLSDKIAKVLTAKNALYEKELSFVCKTLEREIKVCKATIEKEKSNLIKSLDVLSTEKTSVCLQDVDFRKRSFSFPTSVKHRYAKSLSERTIGNEVLCVRDNINNPSSIRDVSLRNELLSPKSATSTQTKQSDIGLDGSSSPCSSQTCEIPAILVTTADMNNNEHLDKPQRKVSLTRSYSTGDLPQNTATSTSPVQMRRIQNTQSGKERIMARDDKTRCCSLALFSQSLSSMLNNENNVLRPKSRSKPYSEEPFYLRKKCISRRCLDRRELNQNTQDGLVNKEVTVQQTAERSLGSILPPIALPSIYTQRNTNNKLVRNHQKPKLTVAFSSLTQNLNDCRYLRTNTK